tara:strand:+ start:208 stop:423 length:216 start_codon:yes stop_codon:yes gene_type:complete
MTSPVSPELQSKIASWRKRAAVGELSLEEMREAISWLRQGRVAAASAAPARSRKRSEAPAAADMLDELGAL